MFQVDCIALERDPSCLEHISPIGHVKCLVDCLLDQKYGNPASFELLNYFKNAFNHQRREAE